MTALWYGGGIKCFDIDVVVLSDGTMLATHPKRITTAISKALEQRHQHQQRNNNNNDDKEKEEEKDVIKIEEYTVDSIYDLLLLSSGGGEEEEKNNNSPFPIFDTELLPHYADLVHTTSTSNTSSPRGQQQVHHHQQEEEVIVPWMLRGPLLNIDLKLGPYLTEKRVLELLQSITDLGLEDYIAICVSPPEAYDYPSSSSSSSLNLWKILHSYNNDKKMETEKKKKKKIIALGLVLRDLVPDEKNVNRIQQLVSQDYDLYKSDSNSDSGADAGADADSGGSIKLLIPSFKFEKEWYNTIRGEVANRSSENDNDYSTGARLLRRLPMTVWTIDTIQDYQYVTSMTTTNGIVMASAVVANNPMKFIEHAITAESTTA
ncbi:hypothetical protein FRACYDRAFT_256528 [Fragilariopsis cylindrus CCMP1102]|uniref:Uncharacterized protein n=1 Tax=Fragilariopsis cylindrus CCMP1102 TaxID=635003 RepID=A0A1E7EJR3_9STRA|nr:hypothetical protein FRACYDRAFT_256528 [Fragilariopsis cylindrus CCMP1102]|eukprot:OEU06102.1 hypothetical protein FRACYDRAFT_256528 [Fragilariopsis cylindrus CCMP1102]